MSNSGIKFVVTCELFWQTLGAYRGHGQYQKIREKIADTVSSKIENRFHRTDRDKPFNPTAALRDIWHRRLSQEFDVVLFYTVSQDTLTLAMLGNHGNYPNAGRGSALAAPLAKKIWNAVEAGHLPSPSWQTLRWKLPLDIVKSRELHEVRHDALAFVAEELEAEFDTMARLRKHAGRQFESLSEAEQRAYVDEIIAALERVAEASRSNPLHHEKTRVPAATFAGRM